MDIPIEQIRTKWRALAEAGTFAELFTSGETPVAIIIPSHIYHHRVDDELTLELALMVVVHPETGGQVLTAIPLEGVGDIRPSDYIPPRGSMAEQGGFHCEISPDAIERFFREQQPTDRDSTDPALPA